MFFSLNFYKNIFSDEAEYLLNILDKLKSGQNIIFTKYGDGEYYCMCGKNGHNVDWDTYNTWLGNALKESLISLSKKPNVYIGKWWHDDAYNYCNVLAQQNNVEIPWAWYHLFMNDDNAFKYDYMHQFVSFIINNNKKKFLICNGANSRLKNLFRADVYIEIPSRNWSFEYEKWKTIIEKDLEDNVIVLIAGGMCSKVLIDDITNKFDLTAIDLGSSFDLLASKRKSRSWQHTYQDELNYYRDLLPMEWD